MSIWDFVRKMAEGKPVFDPSDVSKKESESLQPQPSPPPEPPAQRVEVVPVPPPDTTATTPFTDAQGHKLIPQLTMTQCRSHVSGGQLEVTAWITNASRVAVRIETIVLLDQKTQIDRDLDPGQAHEVVLYRGDAPGDDAAHKAELYYKIRENGDEFCADYTIEYHQEADGTWLIEELRPERIVRDV